MTRKNVVSLLVFLLCAAVVVATVMNVFVESDEVALLAQRAACDGKDKCDFAKTTVLRTPIGQFLEFTNGKSTVQVTCRRSAVLAGDYGCTASR
jgi:hypothetical protein